MYLIRYTYLYLRKINLSISIKLNLYYFRRKINIITLKSEVLEFICHHIFETERRKQREFTITHLILKFFRSIMLGAIEDKDSKLNEDQKEFLKVYNYFILIDLLLEYF